MSDPQNHRNQVLLVLALETLRGPAYAGILLKASPRFPPRNAGYQNRKTLARASEAAHKQLRWKLSPLIVRRADRDWMRSRDPDIGNSALAKKHVVLVGCGMLGSPLAQGLCRGGVGRLTLIDDDIFDAANVGRHVLGASYIGQPKVKALGHHLQASVPSVQVDTIREDVVTQTAFSLWTSDADLVICATADWRSERFLFRSRNQLSNAPPFLVTWLEPYAVAGHAILSNDASDDLCRFFTSEGRPLLRCSEWPNGIPYSREPACQAGFNPADMAIAEISVSMVLNLALEQLKGERTSSSHHYYFHSSEKLAALGGKTSELGALTSSRTFNDQGLAQAASKL